MKKLISLLILALISTQMWASWGAGYFYCKIDSKDGTTGGGTVSAVSGQTTAYNGSNKFSNQTTVTNGGNGWAGGLQDYYFKITATPDDGFKFKEWYINKKYNANGNSIQNEQINDNVITYQAVHNLTCDYQIYAIFELDNSSGNGGEDEPSGPVAGALQSYTVTPGEHVREQVANVSIPNFSNAVDLGFDCLWAEKNVGAASTSYRGTAYT